MKLNFCVAQSNPINTDTEGAIESVRIKCIEFKENVRAFFPQGRSKLSIIIRCPYKAGVRKAGFDCTLYSLDFSLATVRSEKNKEF